jgi:hypothetical protein
VVGVRRGGRRPWQGGWRQATTDVRREAPQHHAPPTSPKTLAPHPSTHLDAQVAQEHACRDGRWQRDVVLAPARGTWVGGAGRGGGGVRERTLAGSGPCASTCAGARRRRVRRVRRAPCAPRLCGCRLRLRTAVRRAHAPPTHSHAARAHSHAARLNTKRLPKWLMTASGASGIASRCSKNHRSATSPCWGWGVVCAGARVSAAPRGRCAWAVCVGSVWRARVGGWVGGWVGVSLGGSEGQACGCWKDQPAVSWRLLRCGVGLLGGVQLCRRRARVLREGCEGLC